METTYQKLQPGDAAYERVKALKENGVKVCDAVDHNDRCSNPDCFNYSPKEFVESK
jgi:hypothetical protein